MVTMKHATSSRNLPSILKRGLLCRKSRQRRKAVWFVRPAKVSWACRHAVMRCGGRIEDVVVLTVDVPRSWLRKHGGGLWYSDRDVPAEMVQGITVFKLVEARA